MDLVGKINKQEIKQKASDKIFSKLLSLDFEIQSLKRDVKEKWVGGVTIEEWKKVLEHQIRDREVWSYIAELIEKDNK
jgi:hypothetical protein